MFYRIRVTNLPLPLSCILSLSRSLSLPPFLSLRLIHLCSLFSSHQYGGGHTECDEGVWNEHPGYCGLLVVSGGRSIQNGKRWCPSGQVLWVSPHSNHETGHSRYMVSTDKKNFPCCADWTSSRIKSFHFWFLFNWMNLLTFRYSPVGIIFLIASKLVEMEDLGTMFEQLAYYMVTVLSGLFIHAFIVLPIIYFVFTRKNPFTFMAGMIKAILTAWGTASR